MNWLASHLRGHVSTVEELVRLGHQLLYNVGAAKSYMPQAAVHIMSPQANLHNLQVISHTRTDEIIIHTSQAHLLIIQCLQYLLALAHGKERPL